MMGINFCKRNIVHGLYYTRQNKKIASSYRLILLDLLIFDMISELSIIKFGILYQLMDCLKARLSLLSDFAPLI